MFSVDNFYSILKSHYGNYQQNNNVLALFRPHGSKDWNNLIHLVDNVQWSGIPPYQQTLIGKIIMHDQEPFVVDNISYARGKCNFVWNTPDCTDVEFLHLIIRSGNVPIICHSELNSPDIRFLERNLFITCYYWWHGMIARDWFRHWQYHARVIQHNPLDYNYRFLLYCRSTDGTRSYRQQIINFIKPHAGIFKYDSEKSNNIPPDESARIEVNDVDCGIHIVAETLFDTEKIYLTEKVFKPMVMRQPFIVYGPPGTLQYLKTYGFETFPELLDESYDSITDATARLNFINAEIEKLCNLSTEEFNVKLLNCQQAVAHNHQYFFSEKFQQILVQELFTNMDRAIDIQQQMEIEYPGGSWLWANQQLITKNLKRPAHWDAAFAQQKQWYQENNPADFEKIQTLYPDVFK